MPNKHPEIPAEQRFDDHAPKCLHEAQDMKTPSIAGIQPAKTQFWSRRRQIVSALARKREKFGSDFDAYQMRNALLALRGTATVTEIARQRRVAAGEQRPTQHIGFG